MHQCFMETFLDHFFPQIPQLSSPSSPPLPEHTFDVLYIMGFWSFFFFSSSRWFSLQQDRKGFIVIKLLLWVLCFAHGGKKDNTLTLETFIVLLFYVLRHEIVEEKMMNKTSKNRRDSFRFFFFWFSIEFCFVKHLAHVSFTFRHLHEDEEEEK
jgi:hypothetical protein